MSRASAEHRALQLSSLVARPTGARAPPTDEVTQRAPLPPLEAPEAAAAAGPATGEAATHARPVASGTPVPAPSSTDGAQRVVAARRTPVPAPSSTDGAQRAVAARRRWPEEGRRTSSSCRPTPIRAPSSARRPASSPAAPGASSRPSTVAARNAPLPSRTARSTRRDSPSCSSPSSGMPKRPRPSTGRWWPPERTARSRSSCACWRPRRIARVRGAPWTARSWPPTPRRRKSPRW